MDTSKNEKNITKIKGGIMNTSKNNKNGLLEKFIDVAAALLDREVYYDIIDFDSCISFMEKNRVSYPEVSGFVISVEKNPTPRNKNDKLLITQGMTDSGNKPIIVEGHTLSRELRARTIDRKMIDFLDGEKVKICKINI